MSFSANLTLPLTSHFSPISQSSIIGIIFIYFSHHQHSLPDSKIMTQPGQGSHELSGEGGWVFSILTPNLSHWFSNDWKPP
jgi:hypothetical protein